MLISITWKSQDSPGRARIFPFNPSVVKSPLNTRPGWSFAVFATVTGKRIEERDGRVSVSKFNVFASVPRMMTGNEQRFWGRDALLHQYQQCTVRTSEEKNRLRTSLTARLVYFGYPDIYYTLSTLIASSFTFPLRLH